MSIELSESVVSSHKLMVGDDTLNVSAGKKLTIETSPSGEEFLDITCPSDKSWEVTVFVRITETSI